MPTMRATPTADDSVLTELRALVVDGLPIKTIAQRLRLKPTTVRRLIERNGLPRPHEIRRQAVADAIAAGVKELERTCKRHGRTTFALVGSNHRPHCKLCRAEAVARRRRKVKRILIEEAGGCCRMCGYDEFDCALEFHHLDPAEKGFGIAQRGITRSIERVRAEARKCVLLCANCHAAVEAGQKALPLELGAATGHP